MKPLFSMASQGGKLPNLPPYRIITASEPSYLPLTAETFLDNSYDLVVYHARYSPKPAELGLIYQLPRISAKRLLVFHHSNGKKIKRYHMMLRIAGLKGTKCGRMSTWLGSKKLPQCKEDKSLERQSKRFYKELLGKPKRLLEILPKHGNLSRYAMQRQIPVTVLVLGQKTSYRIEQILRGESPV